MSKIRPEHVQKAGAQHDLRAGLEADVDAARAALLSLTWRISGAGAEFDGEADRIAAALAALDHALAEAVRALHARDEVEAD